MAFVQHVAHWQIRAQFQLIRGFRKYLRAGAQVQNSTESVERPAGKVEEGEFVHWKAGLRAAPAPGKRR